MNWFVINMHLKMIKITEGGIPVDKKNECVLEVEDKLIFN